MPLSLSDPCLQPPRAHVTGACTPSSQVTSSLQADMPQCEIQPLLTKSFAQQTRVTLLKSAILLSSAFWPLTPSRRSILPLLWFLNFYISSSDLFDLVFSTLWTIVKAVLYTGVSAPLSNRSVILNRRQKDSDLNDCRYEG